MERCFLLIQVSGRWMNGWIQPSQPPNVEDDEGFLLETASSSRQRIPDVTTVCNSNSMVWWAMITSVNPKSRLFAWEEMKDVDRWTISRSEVRNLSYTSHSKLHASNGEVWGGYIHVSRVCRVSIPCHFSLNTGH